MDATRRSRPADSTLPGTATLRTAVAAALRDAGLEGSRVAVALSGGRDSIALVDAAASVRDDLRVALVALHVHHGLSPHADRWVEVCRDRCAALGVPLAIRRVEVSRRPRTSIEATARDARYAALAGLALAQGAGAVLLAHHADDQAETVLLQLVRGSGPQGLAAMPADAVDRGVRWLRPFIGVPREAIDAYVAVRGLGYVDDESNADPRYRRNALRARVVPALRALAPGYPLTVVRAARLQADAGALLDDLAAIDARSAYDGASLAREPLRALGPRRAANLLRWFLREHGLPAPSSVRLAEMLRQLANAGDDAQVKLVHAGRALGIHRGRIFVHRPQPLWWAQPWSGAETVELPHGTLRLLRVEAAGIAAGRLGAGRVIIRPGSPGERLGLAGRPRRPVADLLREAGVPPWERTGLPRVCCDDVLVAVAGIGVDARFAATDSESGYRLEWRPLLDGSPC